MVYYIFYNDSKVPIGKYKSLDSLRARIVRYFQMDNESDYLTVFKVRSGTTTRNKLVGKVFFDIGRHEVVWQVGRSFKFISWNGSLKDADV